MGDSHSLCISTREVDISGRDYGQVGHVGQSRHVAVAVTSGCGGDVFLLGTALPKISLAVAFTVSENTTWLAWNYWLQMGSTTPRR